MNVARLFPVRQVLPHGEQLLPRRVPVVRLAGGLARPVLHGVRRRQRGRNGRARAILVRGLSHARPCPTSGPLLANPDTDRFNARNVPPRRVSRNCAEVRILTDAADENAVVPPTDAPPMIEGETTTTSSAAGLFAPATSAPSRIDGNDPPPAGGHGKTIVGYYAVSFG
jgi:hypothetical protein